MIDFFMGLLVLFLFFSISFTIVYASRVVYLYFFKIKNFNLFEPKITKPKIHPKVEEPTYYSFTEKKKTPKPKKEKILDVPFKSLLIHYDENEKED